MENIQFKLYFKQTPYLFKGKYEKRMRQIGRTCDLCNDLEALLLQQQ